VIRTDLLYDESVLKSYKQVSISVSCKVEFILDPYGQNLYSTDKSYCNSLPNLVKNRSISEIKHSN